MQKVIVILIVLSSIFIIRLYFHGPLQKSSQNPELEAISSELEPFRNSLTTILGQYLSNPQSALLAGMVLGVKEDLPSEFKKSLRETSTIHIVVVSGQNLSMLAGFLMGFSRIIGRRKAAALSLIVILFYTFLTGLQIPTIRAAIMVFFGFLAGLFGREKYSLWILSLTGYIMLLYQPDWLNSLSFQLSFLATLAVVKIAPVFEQKLHKIPDILRTDLSVSIAAQLLTLPIIAYNFREISLVGILVNTLILWTVPLIMIFGMIVIFASFISVTLGSLIVFIPNILLTYFTAVVEMFAAMPLDSLKLGQTSIYFWMGYYFLLLGIFTRFRANLEVTKKEQDFSQKF